MKKTILAILILVCVQQVAFGASIWFGNGDLNDGLWSRPDNWANDPRAVPIMGDIVKIGKYAAEDVNGPLLFDETVIDVNAAYCDQILIYGASIYEGDPLYQDVRASVIFTGGEFNVGDDFSIGESGQFAGGDVNITDCNITVGYDSNLTGGHLFAVGKHQRGTLVMSGGVIDVNGTLGIPSHLNTGLSVGSTFELLGGTFICNDFIIPDAGQGKMNIEQGLFVIRGVDKINYVYNRIQGGFITGYNEANNLNVRIVNGDTYVWACASELRGDFDHNCYVDFCDFAILADNWMLTDCNTPAECGGADINVRFGDGTVDSNDLNRFSDEWLTGE
jgi:hypothetical protein